MIEVSGAPGTLYANETYQLQVDFPEHYPMEAPQVCFPYNPLLFFFWVYVLKLLFPIVYILIFWFHMLCCGEQVIFLNPAPLHPHIYSNGHICLGNCVGTR